MKPAENPMIFGLNCFNKLGIVVTDLQSPEPPEN